MKDDAVSRRFEEAFSKTGRVEELRRKPGAEIKEGRLSSMLKGLPFKIDIFKIRF